MVTTAACLPEKRRSSLQSAYGLVFWSLEWAGAWVSSLLVGSWVDQPARRVPHDGGRAQGLASVVSLVQGDACYAACPGQFWGLPRWV